MGVVIGHGDSADEIEAHLIILVKKPRWDNRAQLHDQLAILHHKRLLPGHHDRPHLDEFGGCAAQSGDESVAVQALIGMGAADDEG